MPIDLIKPAGDPQVGNLATPVNSSPLVTGFINNLPAYRPGLDPKRRGLEVGMAHGYLLYGPFTLLGPLRSADLSNLVGLLSTAGLVVVLTVCLTLYSKAGVGTPIATVTTPTPPKELATEAGWAAFTQGFLIGGLGGAAVAFAVFSVVGSVL